MKRQNWDSTSLAALVTDPLAYHWEFNLGYRPEKGIAIAWGSAWHETVATYLQVLACTNNRVDALHAAIHTAYKVGDALQIQGLSEEAKPTDRKARNMRTLLRSIVWFDIYWATQPYETVILEGIPQVEVRYEFEYCHRNFVVNLDHVVVDEQGRYWVVERKSTTAYPTRHYFQRYDGSPQINTYAWAAANMLPVKIHGVLIEACQNGVTFTRFEPYEVHRTPQTLEWWGSVIATWIDFAKQREALGDWAKWATGNTVLTPLWRMIQSQPPELWQHYLESYCDRELPWDPCREKTYAPTS